jgi:hypothetical protein
MTRTAVKAAVSDGALALARVILIFMAAQILDLGTTILGIRDGLGPESNPLVAPLVRNNLELSLSLKLLVATLVMLMVLRFVSQPRQWKVLMVMAAIALVAPLVNALQLLTLTG